MKGFLATLLVLATMDFHMQLAAAEESDAIAGIVAKMAKPAALNAVRTSKAVDGDVPLAAVRHRLWQFVVGCCGGSLV